MPEESKVKIRVKSGDSEAEIEASLPNIREAIELIPQVLSKLPLARAETRPAPTRYATELPSIAAGQISHSSIPSVTIEKGDSLSDVISKFFSDSWGRNPRKLME